jgi:hypothetical protein
MMYKGEEFILAGMGFALGVICTVSIALTFYDHTKQYKQGQVDALTGKVIFELKKHPDGTVTWERKKNETISSQQNSR